jgi:hypothetical protein
LIKNQKISHPFARSRDEGTMNETRQSLLLRAQTGEQDAWKDLTNLYRPLILGWLQRQGVPARDLDDLSQEVLLSVVKHLPTFEHTGHRGAFRAAAKRDPPGKAACQPGPASLGGSRAAPWARQVPRRLQFLLLSCGRAGDTALRRPVAKAFDPTREKRLGRDSRQ